MAMKNRERPESGGSHFVLLGKTVNDSQYLRGPLSSLYRRTRQRNQDWVIRRRNGVSGASGYQAGQLRHSCCVTFVVGYATEGMDTSGLPVPDAIHPLLEQLQEALVLEIKYQPNLQLPTTTQNDEITIGARDGSAHVLRCLKVWYDLPSDVFFIAINLMDRFLTKMKARPKHMACISVSAFHIAAVQMAQSLDADHLVSISQCKCTGGDLKRMSEVIRNKLEWVPGTQPITPLTFLRMFNTMFHTIALHLGLGDIYASIVTESELLLRLEMVACDSNCASLRPSEVALVLLCTYLDAAVNRLDASTEAAVSNAPIPGPSNLSASPRPAHQLLRLVEFAKELRKICKISDKSFFSTHEAHAFYVQPTSSPPSYLSLPSTPRFLRRAKLEKVGSLLDVTQTRDAKPLLSYRGDVIRENSPVRFVVESTYGPCGVMEKIMLGEAPHRDEERHFGKCC
ncbi:hypothetical protein KM043_001482 [Ampulex compressa]|nr:hypothetical protein KM043_001482 [Ampulex compressa]